jgi:glycosyltransferase involved in cell wall biosynthesis
MPRLMFVTGSLAHGGAERHAITVMNRLEQRGHDCHAVYIKGGDEQLCRIRLRDSAAVRCLDAVRYLDRRALAGFARHIARVGPSAIIAANAYALMYASLALRLSRLRVPVIVTFHSTRLLDAKEWLQMIAYRLFFWQSDCLVFVCEKQRRYWQHRGVFSRRNEVIYNGVDTEEFCDRWNAAQRAALRTALGFRDSDYVIGLSAVLRREKNHLQLLDAVAMLRHRGIPARALMIGDGPMRGAIEARARNLRLSGDMVITGFQQDVRPYVAACDAMTLCSTTEAFSLAAVEAMALSRPVVLSEVGGAAEMVSPGRNGFLFPVGDTRALVNRLAMLADRRISISMGKAARKAVETSFSETTMVDRYEHILRQTGIQPGIAGAAAGSP